MVALGVFSLLLMPTGLKFQLLYWMDGGGPVLGVILRLALIVAGVVIWRAN